MTLLHPQWLLLTAILFIVYFTARSVRHQDDWYRVLSADVYRYLQGKTKSPLKRLTGLLVAAIAAAALTNPSLPSENTTTYTQTQGWIVVADLSRSMTISDIAPSRLSAMRDVAEQLATLSTSHPMALIAFAGDAFLISPPAFDKTHYSTNVQLLDHGLLPAEGSNLSRALSLASTVVEGNRMLNSRLLLLTDTGGMTASAQAAVSRLTDLGHTTDLIVFATENTTSNAPFDIEAAEKMVAAGNGTLVLSDSLGNVSLDQLHAASGPYTNNSLLPSGVEMLSWANQSHWLLLILLPLILLMFIRERS